VRNRVRSSVVNDDHRPRGRRPGKSNTREQILDEAEFVIATKGPDGFTLQEVADRVGIRPPSIFSHFKGTAALTEAVFNRILDGATRAIANAPVTTPVETLLQFAEEFTRFMGSNPAHTRLMLQQFASGNSQEAAFHRFDSGAEAVEEMLEKLDALIQLGIKEGEIRDGIDRKHFGGFLVGAVLLRLAWTDFDGWDKPDWAALVDDIVKEVRELLTRYLKP
jgi:AcrR family transcriptional regulator